MAAVRSRDTHPEMIVRRLAHACGYRFRLHRRNLPGTPDLVFNRFRAVVFVNGCFWHQHQGCKRAKRPVARANYWNRKLDRNKQRDVEAKRALRALGWRTLTIWECELTNATAVTRKLKRFLDFTPVTRRRS